MFAFGYHFYVIYWLELKVVTENLNLSTDQSVQPATILTPTPITEQGSHIKAVCIADVILS